MLQGYPRLVGASSPSCLLSASALPIWLPLGFTLNPETSVDNQIWVNPLTLTKWAMPIGLTRLTQRVRVVHLVANGLRVDLGLTL